MHQLEYESMVRKSGELLMQQEAGAKELIDTPQASLMAPTGLATAGGREGRCYISRFSIYAKVPPATDLPTVLQRADDISSILRMLNEPQTSAVILSGEPGTGKSTLAAILYHHLQNVEGALPDTFEKPGRVRTEGTRKGPHLPTQPPLPLHDPMQVAVGTGVDERSRGGPLRMSSSPDVPPSQHSVRDRGGDVRGGIRHFVWLSLGPNATLPDVIAAILSGIDGREGIERRSASSAHGLYTDFFLLKPEQQMALLVQALRRPEESAFIVLDSFEELLNPARAETSSPTPRIPTSAPISEGLPGRGAIALFFETLRDVDIGASRLLLTSYRSPDGYGADTSALGTINRPLRNGRESGIRSYLVSRVSIPEGVALLQQRGVQGSHSELSLVWQRCGGHVFALVLFSILTSLSGFSLSYLLNSPDYAPMWNGEVTRNLIGTIYYYLNPIQRTLMRALCLFAEPMPLDGIASAIMGENEDSDGHDSAYNGGHKGVSPYKAFQHELSALVEMSLVQEQSKGIGQHSYFLHPLLRSYTVEHYLEGSDRRSSVDRSIALGVAAPPDSMGSNPEARQIALAAGHMRVAAYYARLAQEFCPPREQRSGLADVESILAMIRHFCLGWHWEEAYNLLRAEGLHEDMLQWGALNALIGLYTAMLPPVGVLSRSDFGEVCGQLGVLYGRLGEDAQSRAYYEQALSAFREVGDGYAEAVTLANEGELLRGMGEWEKARGNFEQALALNRQYADEHVQCVLLHNIGLLFQVTKDYAHALPCYVEALKVAHRLQERYNEGMILSNMGFLLYEQGHLPEALALLSYAVQMRQSLHDPAVSAVIDFLQALEQKMGPEAFARLSSSPAANYNLGTHDLISRLLNSPRQF